MDLWGSWEKERISEKPSPVPAPWQRVNIHGETVGLKAVLRMGFFIHSWRWAGRGGKVRLVYLKANAEMKVWTLENMPGQGQASSVVAFWLLYNHQVSLWSARDGPPCFLLPGDGDWAVSFTPARHALNHWIVSPARTFAKEWVVKLNSHQHVINSFLNGTGLPGFVHSFVKHFEGPLLGMFQEWQV